MKRSLLQMSNKSKIQALEKKIDQLANRISLQKNKERFLAQKRKTTLGKIFVTIQQILTAVHKFKQFSIKQHDQSIHCFNSMLSTGHQI